MVDIGLAPMSQIKQGGSMFFYIYEVAPKESHPQHGMLGGAYVHCWLDLATQEEAHGLASSRLDDAGWIIRACQHQAEVGLEDYLNDEEAMDYYKQAQKAREAYVFHVWPLED